MLTRVWGTNINPKNGKRGPYHSKQIIIAPDIEIKKIWEIKINTDGVIFIDGKFVDFKIEGKMARHDGLYFQDFLDWLVNPCITIKKTFSGQIICWNENIEY